MIHQSMIRIEIWPIIIPEAYMHQVNLHPAPVMRRLNIRVHHLNVRCRQTQKRPSAAINKKCSTIIKFLRDILTVLNNII